MKLNHAQRKHLTAKLNDALQIQLGKMREPSFTFSATMPCKVTIRTAAWSNRNISTSSAVPAVWRSKLTVAQRAALAKAEKLMAAYVSRRERKNAIVAEFEETLLFADGGLDEAKALLAKFVAKL